MKLLYLLQYQCAYMNIYVGFGARMGNICPAGRILSACRPYLTLNTFQKILCQFIINEIIIMNYVLIMSEKDYIFPCPARRLKKLPNSRVRTLHLIESSEPK